MTNGNTSHYVRQAEAHQHRQNWGREHGVCRQRRIGEPPLKLDGVARHELSTWSHGLKGKSVASFRKGARLHVLSYQVSPYGLTSTLNDHAERGWFATCHASSAIAAGAMKKSSGWVLKRSRAHGTSITASMTM